MVYTVYINLHTEYKCYVYLIIREGAIIICKIWPLFGGLGFRFQNSTKVRFKVSLNSPKLGFEF